MRDVTRDVVRGLTVLEMETVNNTSLPLLGHAPIEAPGITYADTVFPTFAFLAGMTPAPLSRGVSLIGLGIAYNSIGLIRKGKEGLPPRYVGVLQRTGLSSIIFNALPKDPVFPLLTTGAWSAISFFLADNKQDPFAIPEGTAQTKIDKAVFPEKSLYKPSYDPEGLLGSLMTSVSLWLGYWFATSKLSVEQASLAGAACIAGGYSLAYAFPKHTPISKPYWTPSFTLIAGGYSILKYTFVSAFLLPRLPQSIIYGLTCLGKRSLEVFFSSAILGNVLAAVPAYNRLYQKLVDKFGPTAVDIGHFILHDSLMVFLAIKYVEHGWRIRLW